MTTVIAALRVSLCAWIGRGSITLGMLVPLANRLGVISISLDRLMARFLAGKTMRRGPRVGVVVAVEKPVEAGRKVQPARFWPLPTGWLLKERQHHAALYTNQLETLLVEPEMVALLTASDQAGRLLRPMCRMLGVNLALLRPGVPVVVKAPVEPVKRVRKKRPPIDWGRIPLPRGVLSAARRAGFKPVR